MKKEFPNLKRTQLVKKIGIQWRKKDKTEKEDYSNKYKEAMKEYKKLLSDG